MQFVRGHKMPVNINIFIILETPLKGAENF